MRMTGSIPLQNSPLRLLICLALTFLLIVKGLLSDIVIIDTSLGDDADSSISVWNGHQCHPPDRGHLTICY